MSAYNSPVPAITISHLTVSYHDVPVLWDISATIPSGVLLAIMGPNGAGKTTLIKTMLGLIQPLAGSVAFFNKPYTEVRSSIGYVPQRMSVDWDFPVSVFDVVLMGRYRHIGWIRRAGKYDKQKVWEALELVGLCDYAQHHISQLSGGQQQRVFIARALAQDATMYILDEPFSGVDAPTETFIMNLLKQLCRAGKTIIVVHHNMHTLNDYFDWLLLLNRRLMSCGPLSTLSLSTSLKATYNAYNISPV